MVSTTNGNGVNGGQNGVKLNGKRHAGEGLDRPHPQTSFIESTIDPQSFYGKMRKLYSEKVLMTQLKQLKKQGSYDAFDLKWHPSYDIARLHKGHFSPWGFPPTLFWDSDVGKWIEAVCYFLNSPDGANCAHKSVFDASVQELITKIEKAQLPDGYLNIYFMVVDPEGRYENFRDMHEMYNAGHLLEAALAHHHYSGSRQFLDIMLRNVECWMRDIGPNEGQIHAYPGHPELELAMLRLFDRTKDPRHFDFAKYLITERGKKRDDLGGDSFFVYERKKRNDPHHGMNMDHVDDITYNQSHAPLSEQDSIVGHSVRALYLTTAAADLGGEGLTYAKRMWDDAVDNKMYVVGGFGSEPRFEGFHKCPHWLPDSFGLGYLETCAAIAAMMTAERLLSHQLDGKVRDVMELALLNAVLGGGSLNGEQFAYANTLATIGDENATRKDWFTVCCCPPNLSRTLGLLGGYTWSSRIDYDNQVINLDIYLFVSAKKNIVLPDGSIAEVQMITEMPWTGKTTLSVNAPADWSWGVRVPTPEYAANIEIDTPALPDVPGYVSVRLDASATVSITFDLPTRLIANHPLTTQDTLTVSRGPIVYTAESYDNSDLESKYKHFQGLGIKSSSSFQETPLEIEGIPMVGLSTAPGDVWLLEEAYKNQPYRAVSDKRPARTWTRLEGQKLTFVPWFARANRGGAGHVRTSFLRADEA
ncbi:hypothetical protein I317_03305 [Kwoniella heveanensis CBS 569]|nr:hypothetical protein I317_03305 [Kwoniella heveanensis CBS 569]